MNDLMKVYKEVKNKKNKACTNLDEFQAKYYPSRVGKDCPYCSKPFDYEKCIAWLRNKLKPFMKIIK